MKNIRSYRAAIVCGLMLSVIASAVLVQSARFLEAQNLQKTHIQASRPSAASSTVSRAAQQVVSPTVSRPATFPGTNDQWRLAEDAAWIAEEKAHHEIKPHANNKSMLSIKSQRDGAAYGHYTEEDILLWERETERMVVEGSKIFHSADLIGSTIAVSCDMCHPDAQGTHPETYPKYQVQLGRPALLRDMINWCLTHPCRGEPLSGDDPRMRAMEAYIQAQRTGVPMKYGKH